MFRQFDEFFNLVFGGFQPFGPILNAGAGRKRRKYFGQHANKSPGKNASTTAAAGWRHDNCQLSRQLNTLACNPSLVQMLSKPFRWDFYRKKEIIIAFVVYYHCSHGFEYHMNQRYCTGNCKKRCRIIQSMLIFDFCTLLLYHLSK